MGEAVYSILNRRLLGSLLTNLSCINSCYGSPANIFGKLLVQLPEKRESYQYRLESYLTGGRYKDSKPGYVFIYH